MNKCLNCEKEVVQTEGKRKKEFCSDGCRASFWQKNNKKERKYVNYKTFQELKDRFDGITAQMKATPLGQKIMQEIKNNPSTFQIRDIGLDGEVKAVHKVEFKDYELTDMKSRIEVLEKELKNPPLSPLIGIKAWRAVREKELTELRKQIT